MPGPLEQRLDRRPLDDLPGIHHGDLVAHFRDDAEVVGDEHDGGADLVFQLPKEVEDLRLDGDVERSGRLVGDQQLRSARERNRNHRALPHATGEVMGIIVETLGRRGNVQAVTTIPQGGTGDVKYHHGAQGSYQLPDGSSILVNLESNPSHLEYVGPVVTGATRAAQTTRMGPHAHRDTDSAVPIVLHGDAALPGQGVVPETLNLQALDGYNVGGTLHLVQNNQVGFTTDPDDARSTRWASDIAKGFDVPIIHVNADDVSACVSAVRLAWAFRQEFGHDVMIDLIGYRRFGHNEADEPAYTQPAMYERIKQHRRVADIWADAARRARASSPRATSSSARARCGTS